jgi:hypothetical protein
MYIDMFTLVAVVTSLRMVLAVSEVSVTATQAYDKDDDVYLNRLQHGG